MLAFVRNTCLLGFLLLVSQLSYFSNQLLVEVQPDQILLTAHLSSISAPIALGQVVKVTSSVQNSAFGQAGLREWKIYRSHDEDPGIAAESKSVFFLFGLDWLNNLIKGASSDFDPGFGDWTMEDSNWFETSLYQGDLQAPFFVKLNYLGRGAKIVHFYSSDGRKVSLDVSDGLLNNSFHICDASGCPGNAYSVESRGLNISRVLNFLVECLIAALLILILWDILSAVEQRLLSLPRQELVLSQTFLYSILGILALIHFCWAWYFSAVVLDSTPHIPDSAVYYRQAMLLARGLFSIPNFNFEPVEAIMPNGSLLRDGNLHFHYNHFWPIVLALAIKLHIIEVVVPLLSACSLLLCGILAKKFYGNFVGIIAALLYCVSPLTIIMAGDFLMHTATQFFMLCAFYLSLKSLETSKISLGLVVGALWAFCFGMRQLTTLAVILPLAVYTIIFYSKSIKLRLVLSYLLGATPLLQLILLDNLYLTGKMLTFPHQVYHGLSLSWSSLADGLNNCESCLGYLAPIIFAAPNSFIFFGTALLTFVVRPNRTDFLLLSTFVSLFVAYCFTNANGLHGFGPRFLFEACFCLFILVARGLQVLWFRSGEVSRALLGLIAIILVSFNCYRVYLTLPRYENYNTIFTGVLPTLRAMDLRNTVLLTKEQSWYGLDLGVTFFDPYYKDSIFLKILEDGSQAQILKRYQGRQAYEIVDQSLKYLGRIGAQGLIELDKDHAIEN